jgi:hypothetical protein
VAEHEDQTIVLASIAELEPFHLYTFCHSILTRWAKEMAPYTLAYLASHSDFATTKRYIHPEETTVVAAMDRTQQDAVIQ